MSTQGTEESGARLDPAFPRTERHNDGSTVAYYGMSLRDYFAAKAMEGVLSSTEPDETVNEVKFAGWCYRMADAMLAARRGTP